MTGRRRETQSARAKRPDTTARLGDVRFARAGRLQEGELRGEDLPRGRLNGGDQAWERR
jgi:hypothetical protein